MQTHLWTWNYTCVISPWESTKIKTKTISRSVFSSQILQNAEMNIVVYWKFWRKYGSVSHLFSCKTYFFIGTIHCYFEMRLHKSFGLNMTIFFEKPHKCIYKQISSVTQCRLDLVSKVFLVTSKKAFFYRFRFFYDASELWRKPKLQFFAPK